MRHRGCGAFLLPLAVGNGCPMNQDWKADLPSPEHRAQIRRFLKLDMTDEEDVALRGFVAWKDGIGTPWRSETKRGGSPRCPRTAERHPGRNRLYNYCGVQPCTLFHMGTALRLADDRRQNRRHLAGCGVAQRVAQNRESPAKPMQQRVRSERVGFEPTVRLPVQRFSRPLPQTEIGRKVNSCRSGPIFGLTRNGSVFGIGGFKSGI